MAKGDEEASDESSLKLFYEAMTKGSDKFSNDEFGDDSDDDNNDGNSSESSDDDDDDDDDDDSSESESSSDSDSDSDWESDGLFGATGGDGQSKVKHEKTTQRKQKTKKMKQQKRRRKRKNKVEEMATPEILTAKLRPYQQTALRWMLNREKRGKDAEQASAKPQLHPLFEERHFPDAKQTKYYYSSDIGVLTTRFIPAPPEPRGGILADEMGLGKTVEVISLICSNRMADPQSYVPVARGDSKEKKYLSRATLVVTPLTIVDQWKSEIERHTNPPLKTYIYQGNRRVRDIAQLLQYDVIITTYNTLSFEYSQAFLGAESTRKKKKANHGGRDSASASKDLTPSPMFQMEFFRVVLDEAHNIKNRKSLQARATTAVEANRRWAVTGTPIQNHIDDLFSLFHFLRVTPHGDWRWWFKNIGKPFEKKDKKAAVELQSVIGELVIRRTKDKRINGVRIVKLPPKRITVMELEFSEAEAHFYNSLYDYAKGKFNEFVQSGTVLKNYANILEMLLHLRQVCDHPALIISSFQKKSERSTMKGFLEEFSKKTSFLQYDKILPMLPSVLKYNAKRESSNDANVPGMVDVNSFLKLKWRDSSKTSALVDYLKYKVSDTTKSVVFSQWTSMLDLVEIALQKSGIKFVRLDGRMQRKDRESAVDNFKNDPEVSVCLISLKVGGIGLNLVWATHVFLLDPWWNPAIEQQAIDRVHRIGQEEGVTVIRFVIKGTVEERIMTLQKTKTKIATDALDISNRDNENDYDPDNEFIKEDDDEDDEFAEESTTVTVRQSSMGGQSLMASPSSSSIQDDDDEFESVLADEEEDFGAGIGFGMTKRDAQNIRLKDVNYLFGF